MIIEKWEEETTDFDWFALDDQGKIGHFTTGGFGALPQSVASSKEDLEKLVNYM
jgi:hypothetical protein